MALGMTTIRHAARRLGAALLAAVVFGGTGLTCRAADSPTVLENDRVLLEVDPARGTILRILDKASSIELAPPRALAENFRLVVLLPDKTTATILGKDQKLSSAIRTEDGLALAWTGPLVDTAGAPHKIAVRMDVKAVGNELQFQLHLENGATGKLQEAWYPMIGGLAEFGPPGKPADAVLWAPTPSPSTKKVASPFGCETFGYPGRLAMSFTCLESAAAGRSLYFASHDAVARFKVYRFEEHAQDHAKDVFACIQHLPYTPPGETFDGSTVVLRVVDGDWRAGGKAYRAWFERTFGIAQPADSWIRRESFFQMTMFELPEGTITMRFRDIPKWAKDAKDHGVHSVMISGWNRGGHDNGYPHYTVDPRLGTWEELEQGIRACHAMGVNVYFFVNFQPVMFDTDWYKTELVKYREHNAEGGITWNVGWGMGTLWARMDHPKRMTWANPAFPQFRKIIVDQFARLAQIGADGVHVDKVYPSAMDFNPESPMGPDTAPWQGTILLSREVMEACRKHNPRWAMSFECNWDRLLEFGGATWWVGNQPVTRLVFPENAETLLIFAAYDYLGVNNAVRQGHVVMLGPLNFCRSVAWKPWERLADYVKEVKRIQDGLTDTVFLGEVLGQDGVRLDGPPAAGVAYNVFRNRATGRRACVLTNATMTPKRQTIAAFDPREGGNVRVHAPFAEVQIVALPAAIEIPAERIVFVEELGSDPAANPGLAGASPSRSPDAPARATAGLPSSAVDPAGQAIDKDASVHSQQSIKLEDDRYLVEASRENGSITRILDKRSGLELLREPRLADNFRFTLPIPGKEPWETIEANYIWGSRQTLSSFDVAKNKLTLHWNKPLVNYLGEPFDVSATMEIELAEEGILFGLAIDNATPYQIGEVFFPLIGGMQGLGKTDAARKATQFVRPRGADALATMDVFRVFPNHALSWLGDQGPEQFFAYPKDLPEPWMALVPPGGGRSVCFGARDVADRPIVLRLEMVPSNSGTVREDGNWPRPGELAGQPVGVSACFVEFANAPAGGKYEAPRALVAFFEGDGAEARRVFKGQETPADGTADRRR
ncbi:MAG: hypothetical protein JW809_06610 [Pirellulales bacterium]|nr:hypothetical protein [Pirellulales bacterium]